MFFILNRTLTMLEAVSYTPALFVRLFSQWLLNVIFRSGCGVGAAAGLDNTSLFYENMGLCPAGFSPVLAPV